jgi:hypothetical protein
MSTKTAFIDFKELKKRTSIEAIVQMLGLQMVQKNDQWRSPCPTCQRGGPRALAVNTTKQSFFCHASGNDFGDLIALVAHVRLHSQTPEAMQEAAKIISDHLGTGDTVTSATVSHRAPSPRREAPGGPLRPLEYLEPEHEAVQALGVTPATAAAFESGYAGKGVLRGRYAVPIKGRDGALLAYVGIAVTKEQSPRLLFHNFDPHSQIFHQECVAEGGDISVCRDPLALILAIENGVEDTLISFLTEGITAQQFEQLASLMDEKKIETAFIY